MNGVEYLVGSAAISNHPMCPFNDAACDFIGLFSERLMRSAEAKQFPDVIALAFWARRGNIQKLKERYSAYIDRLGRGLVFHITPANIPVNFAFSFLFSVLSGNANIVRVPSKLFPQIPMICDILSESLVEFPAIQEMTAFVQYPADDETTAAFCALADARIIWGGDATVTHIRGFTAKPRCIDLVFPDRYSFCIIDGKTVAAVSDKELERLAKAFYNDTFLMDQNACSSPQLILWQNVDPRAKERFWQAVVACANKKYNLQPAVAIDKYLKFCSDAIVHDTIVSIKRNENILYRVSFSSLPAADLTDFRGQGGYFYEYDLQSLEELAPYITEKYQTVTYYGMSPEAIKEIVLNSRLRGIDRVVPIGSAIDIGPVWDGYDLINCLSRTIAFA
jgi:hypothetical protein